MGQTRRDDAYRRATQVYQWIVRFYPAAYRQLFGEQMLQTFQDHYHDAVASGDESAARFWLEVIADEAKAIPRARLASLRGTSRLFSMPYLFQATGWAALAVVVLYVPSVVWYLQTLGILGSNSLTTNAFQVLFLLIWIVIPFTMVLVTTSFLPVLYGRTPGGATPHSRGWLRAGLLLGVLVGVYEVILNLVATLTPSNVYQYAFSVVTTFLAPVVFAFTFGVVGALLGYARGTTRASVAAGFAAGLLAGLMSVASLVLVIALCWDGVRTNAYSSLINYDYLHLAFQSSPPLGLWQFIFEDELGGAALNASKVALLGGSFAALGGTLGARARRRSQRRQTQPPLATGVTGATRRRSPERAFILVMGVLGLVMWLVSALFLGQDAAAGALITPPERLLHSQHYSLYAMSLASLMAPAFVLWAAVFAIPMGAVIVTARRARAHSALPGSRWIPGAPWWLAGLALAQDMEETVPMTFARPRVRRHWRVYLLALLLLPALAGVYGIRSETAYESTASVLVRNQTILTSLGPVDINIFATTAQHVSDQMEQLLRTSSFLLSVAQRTPLNANHALDDPNGEAATLGTPPWDDPYREGATLGPTPAQNAAVSRISGNITVSADQTRNLVFITSDDQDPSVAQQLTNGVIAEFNAVYAQQEQRTLNTWQEVLSQELNAIKDMVNSDTQARDTYASAHPQVLTERAAAVSDHTWQALVKQVQDDVDAQTATQSALDQINVQLAQIDAGALYDLQTHDPAPFPTGQTVRVSRFMFYPIEALVGVLILFALTGISYRTRVALE
jgi:hypothetical protein